MSSLLDNVVVVLNEPKDVVNVAGVMRVMMNMGLSQLRLVNPDEYDLRRITGIAHRSAELAGSTQTFATLRDALVDTVFVVGTSARPRTAPRNYVRPRDVAQEVARRAVHGQAALVFGREDRGLTNAALDLCHSIAVVPTATEYPSLNLAQACLVLCYEVHLAVVPETPLPGYKRDAGPATHADLERMYEALARGLERIDFFKGDRHPEGVLRTLRTLLNRAQPDLRETRLLSAIGFEIERRPDRAKIPEEPAS